METQVLIPGLPDELSFEILVRLPVKSLLKFITISKTWNSLISSSSFIKSHLLASLSIPNFSHHHLLYSRKYFSTTTKPTTIAHHFPLSVLYDPYIVTQDFTYPTQNPTYRPWLIGSINGLVCLATYGSETKLILWNPCIRKIRTLPYLDVDFQHYLTTVYGFGYHSCGDDYKVVAIFCEQKNYGFENEVKVYSRKRDSWRNMEGFKVRIPLQDSGIFVDGKLHWAITPCSNVISESSYKFSIVSIDAGDETYGKLDQPDYGDGKFSMSLGVLGECLCVLCDYFQDRVDFWVMKEYGVKESWTKNASLPELYFDRLDMWDNERVPLCFLKNGNILLTRRNKTRFILYNLEDCSHRYVWQLTAHARYGEALIYVESFVLPYTSCGTLTMGISS